MLMNYHFIQKVYYARISVFHFLYFIVFSARYTRDINQIVQYLEQINQKTLCNL